MVYVCAYVLWARAGEVVLRIQTNLTSAGDDHVLFGFEEFPARIEGEYRGKKIFRSRSFVR